MLMVKVSLYDMKDHSQRVKIGTITHRLTINSSTGTHLQVNGLKEMTAKQIILHKEITFLQRQI